MKKKKNVQLLGTEAHVATAAYITRMKHLKFTNEILNLRSLSCSSEFWPHDGARVTPRTRGAAQTLGEATVDAHFKCKKKKKTLNKTHKDTFLFYFVLFFYFSLGIIFQSANMYKCFTPSLF